MGLMLPVDRAQTGGPLAHPAIASSIGSMGQAVAFLPCWLFSRMRAPDNTLQPPGYSGAGRSRLANTTAPIT
jgi:hypothetical protein